MKNRVFRKRCMYGNHMIHAVECVSARVRRKRKKAKKEEKTERTFYKNSCRERGGTSKDELPKIWSKKWSRTNIFWKIIKQKWNKNLQKFVFWTYKIQARSAGWRGSRIKRWWKVTSILTGHIQIDLRTRWNGFSKVWKFLIESEILWSKKYFFKILIFPKTCHIWGAFQKKRERLTITSHFPPTLSQNRICIFIILVWKISDFLVEYFFHRFVKGIPI